MIQEQKVKKQTKSYYLRVAMTALEKQRLELLVAYTKYRSQKKVTKAGIFSFLVNKEFDLIQGDIVGACNN
jgi:hypothetical protein